MVGMDKKMGIVVVCVACLSSLTMQAQGVKMQYSEVKSVTLDSIPNASLPHEVVTPNVSDAKLPVMGNGVEGLEYETSRPSLGGFPVLSGSSYYSETKDEAPLKIAPNAIPHYTLPSTNIGPIAAYSFSTEVPGLMDKRAAMFVYQQDLGRFSFSPYVGVEQVNTGAYRLGYFNKATFGGNMSYQVNDWLKVGFYGQYVPTKINDMRSVIMSPFMPKSAYGGFVEVMFNQHWGVGAKMGREFAPQKNGKWGWKNTTEFYPIYKK